jgi:S-adenosylmethionine hydrolase
VHGEVLHVDTYGNLVTSIPAGVLPPRFVVRVGDARVVGAPHPHYQAVAPGALLALVGSAELLEVSARDASAAAVTGAGRGSTVVVEGEEAAGG